MLAAGLDGVEKKMELADPVEESLYAMDAERLKERDIKELPGTLAEAIDELEADEVICAALGDHVLSHYVEAKREEWNEYRTQVTQWEIDRYLETFSPGASTRRPRLRGISVTGVVAHERFHLCRHTQRRGDVDGVDRRLAPPVTPAIWARSASSSMKARSANIGAGVGIGVRPLDSLGHLDRRHPAGQRSPTRTIA